MTKQKIGAGLLVVAFVLFWVEEIGFAYGAFIAAGILDLHLVARKEKTISQWIQGLTANKTVDYIVMWSLLGSMAYRIFEQLGFVSGAAVCLPVLIAVLALHLFGDKD